MKFTKLNILLVSIFGLCALFFIGYSINMHGQELGSNETGLPQSQPDVGNKTAAILFYDDLAAKWREALDKICTSVVMLEIEMAQENNQLSPETKKKLAKLNSGGQNPAYRKKPDGAKTGFIIDANGHVITSAYNVMGNPKKIVVYLADGRDFTAELKGYDEIHDIALLKIDATDLIVPIFDKNIPSPPLIVAVSGRSPSFELTLNTGFVTQINRTDANNIQLSLKTNYGNSGGPVFDIEGKINSIVNYVHHEAANGQNSGVGFALPMKKVFEILPELKKGKIILKPKVPYMGIQADIDAVSDITGLKISQVMPNTGAAAAGLKAGDIIVRADNVPITNLPDLKNFLKTKKVADEVDFDVYRDKKIQTFTVILKEKPM